MTTPLPKRNPTTDKSITSIPESQWTARQRAYADMYGLAGATSSTVATAPAAAPAPTAASATPAPVADPLAAMREEAAKQAEESKQATARDAYARLQTVLGDYGLTSLGGSIQNWLQEGLSEAEITQRMRETPEFKTRFPAIEARKKAGLPPISPGEYVAYERQARQMFRSAGLPQGFYDSNDDFTKFLTGDVSLAELTDRVGLASKAAFNSDPTMLQELARFGMTGGDLTAFFLDPDTAEPLLERKFNSAKLSATATKTGFGQLGMDEATLLAQQGVTDAQAQQGFSNLAASSELFNPLDGGEDSISRGEQLGAAFQGNANAQRRIESRAARRKAAFTGGGGYASSATGLSGLGSGSS